MEKLLNALFELEVKENRLKFLKLLDYFLWILLVLITYNQWMNPIGFNPDDISWDAMMTKFFTADYIKLIQWTFFIIIVTSILKYVIIKTLAKSKIALRKYLNLFIPSECKRAVLNVTHQSKRASKENIEIAIGFANGLNDNDDLKIHLQLVIDIILKTVIIIIATLSFLDFISCFISIFSLIASIVILIYCVFGLIIINCKKEVKEKILSVKP